LTPPQQQTRGCGECWAPLLTSRCGSTEQGCTSTHDSQSQRKALCCGVRFAMCDVGGRCKGEAAGPFLLWMACIALNALLLADLCTVFFCRCQATSLARINARTPHAQHHHAPAFAGPRGNPLPLGGAVGGVNCGRRARSCSRFFIIGAASSQHLHQGACRSAPALPHHEQFIHIVAEEHQHTPEHHE